MVASLPPLKKACLPRPEILSGEIRDELFMASLSDVMRGKAHSIYQTPALFFERGTAVHPHACGDYPQNRPAAE